MNSALILFLINECIPKFNPHTELSLNLFPVRGSGKAIIHKGLFIFLAKCNKNFASVNVV